MRGKRYSYEQVKEILGNSGYLLTSTNYTGARNPLSCICPNGHYTTVSVNKFLNGHGCSTCACNRKYTITEVKSIFEKANCTLLSETYNGANKPLRYICQCGNLSITTFWSFRKGHRCRKCGAKQCAEKQRKPHHFSEHLVNLSTVQLSHIELKQYFGVYQIKCETNGRFYVGSCSTSFWERWRHHRKCLRKGKHVNYLMQNSWNKYGESSFNYYVIEIVENKSDTLVREQFHIDATQCFNRNIGFNISKRAF